MYLLVFGELCYVVIKEKEETISISGPPGGLKPSCSCPSCTMIVIQRQSVQHPVHQQPSSKVAQRRASVHCSIGSYRGLYLKVVTPLGHWKHFEDRDFMFLLQARSACSYSTWHPQVLPLKKIPLTSPNVQPCQRWPSILRSLPVVVVSRPHCHRLSWALCDRPLHIHFIKRSELKWSKSKSI